jgi:hypothetical protein
MNGWLSPIWVLWAGRGGREEGEAGVGAGKGRAAMAKGRRGPATQGLPPPSPGQGRGPMERKRRVEHRAPRLLHDELALALVADLEERVARHVLGGYDGLGGGDGDGRLARAGSEKPRPELPRSQRPSPPPKKIRPRETGPRQLAPPARPGGPRAHDRPHTDTHTQTRAPTCTPGCVSCMNSNSLLTTVLRNFQWARRNLGYWPTTYLGGEGEV